MNGRGFGALAAVVMSAAAMTGRASERRLSLDDYRDRLQGAWIGQMVGVSWGMPTEFKWKDEIVPADQVPPWTPERINVDTFGNDDLYVEMTFLGSLERLGLDCPIREAGLDFANSGYGLWCANLAGRQNLRRGIAPPDSSHPSLNDRVNDIDYQIEADYAGIISPGCPQEVIRLGNLFGRLMNFGDGVWAGQFVGALYAEAFFTAEVNRLLDAGLRAIPKESDYAGMVRDVREWHRAFPDDWTKTWQKIRAKYSKAFNPAMRDSNGGIDARLNGAMVVLGLLYGDGNLDRSMEISMRGGYDSDCNPSTVGGVLMCARGVKALDRKYGAGLLDRKRKFTFTPYDFDGLCAVCEKLARSVVVRNGGRVEKDAGGREWFVIPERAPVPDAFVPSWNAGRPLGAKFTAAEMSRQKFARKLPRRRELDDPDPTKRVQNALDVLCPGWKTTANSADVNIRAGYRETLDVVGGQRYGAVVTHPVDKNASVRLSRRLVVPTGEPRLHFEVANAWHEIAFRLRVVIDGAEMLVTDIATPNSKSERPQMRSFDISLRPWEGREVVIELVDDSLGVWGHAAVWHDIRILSNN